MRVRNGEIKMDKGEKREKREPLRQILGERKKERQRETERIRDRERENQR